MKKLFILAAAAAMFAACTNDDITQQSPTENERIPLTLGYTMGANSAATTRANTADLQKNAIDGDNDNMIGLFVLKSGDGTTAVSTASETYERINFPSTALTRNNPAANYTLAVVNTSSSVNGDILLYPENKTQKIDIYAYAPYISNKATASSSISNIPATFGDKNVTTKLYQGNISTDVITFFTETNQTDKDKYYLSDVLWGCAGTGANIVAAADDGVTSGTEGPYELLKGTGSNQANNNEISAKKYLEIKKGDSDGDGTADLTADIRTGAYYYTNSSSSADVVVPMLHRGSQIIMNITTSGMDYKKLQNAEVEFYVDYLSGTLNISTGAFTPIMTTAPPAGSKILLTTHLGIAAPAAAASVTEEGTYKSGGASAAVDGYTCSAVIIPQTITVANGGTSTDQGKEPIIKIKLKDDTSKGAIDGSTVKETATYTYKTDSAAPEFKSGKKYIYNIVVKASGLSVTTTVQDWVDGQGGTPVSGNAELE